MTNCRPTSEAAAAADLSVVSQAEVILSAEGKRNGGKRAESWTSSGTEDTAWNRRELMARWEDCADKLQEEIFWIPGIWVQQSHGRHTSASRTDLSIYTQITSTQRSS